jgi:uncharacterized coiled-coil protein SlyX
LADDELNQNQNPEGEEPEQSQASKITELKGLVAQKDEELTKANARITELEQAVAGSEEKLTTIQNSLADAVVGYKAMVVQANPEVLEELITGDTIESINGSLNKAKTLISRVRQGLETEISGARIPAGAPQRTPPDLSALSPREKIQYAIGGKK